MSKTLTIQDLVRETGLSDRTIKFYIADGLMEGPESPGRYATYGQKHLDRLKLISELAAQGFKLSAIKLRLEQDESAASYVRRALQDMNLPTTITGGLGDVQSEPTITDDEPCTVTGNSVAWSRITLADGVELHCRLPLPEDIIKIVGDMTAMFRDRLEDVRWRRS